MKKAIKETARNLSFEKMFQQRDALLTIIHTFSSLSLEEQIQTICTIEARIQEYIDQRKRACGTSHPEAIRIRGKICNFILRNRPIFAFVTFVVQRKFNESCAEAIEKGL